MKKIFNHVRSLFIAIVADGETETVADLLLFSILAVNALLVTTFVLSIALAMQVYCK